MDTKERLTPLYLAAIQEHPTGSRYICNPAPTDTDNDILVLVPCLLAAAQELHRANWEVNEACEEYDIGETPFITARKGEDNLIVYQDSRGYDLFLKATKAARALNLLRKEDRVALFQAICSVGSAA